MNLHLILNFLEELKINNNREWFAEHKREYEEARKQFELLVESLIIVFQKNDSSLVGTKPKDCVFRIYKDVRFSKDKLPYKTNFGAIIDAGGKKTGRSGFYIQLEPQNSFIAFGAYCPESAKLKLIRHFIYDEVETFQAILEEKEFKKYFGGLMRNGDELKRVPRDFPADWEYAEFLKYKHYVCLHAIADQQIKEVDQLFPYIQKIYKAGLPFNNFINIALNGE